MADTDLLDEEDLNPETEGDARDEEENTGEDAKGNPDDPLYGRPELQKALVDLYGKCIAEDRYPRIVEVKDVKQAEFYWGGRQYIWWSDSTKSWNLPTQGPAQAWGDLDADEQPRYEYVTNIYQATGLTVIGAVAGAPPRYRFFPEDADNPDDIDTAEGRTKLARLIQRWNPAQKMLQEETYHAWTGGYICWWTRYVSDAKYGLDTVHLLNEGAVDTESTIYCPECGWSAPADQAEPPVPCPQCGNTLTDENVEDGEDIPVPEDGGEQQVSKGRQVISVFGALNCKRPQHTNEQSEYHYFGIEREIHYSILRQAFPDLEDEIKPGMGFGDADVYERNARLSVAENTQLLTQTGGAQSSLCTFAVVWYRPAALRMIDNKDYRKELLEIFPRGVRTEICGSLYCQSEAESMDDAIVDTHAMPGTGQHRNAIGTSTISVQDRFNTLTNITQETYEYGIPITYRDSATFSQDADADQRAAPGLEVECVIPDGVDIRTKIYQVRADSVSPDMAKATMDLMGPVTQYLSGTFPALTGAGKDQPETLGQQSMQRDQAMGRMGVFYVNLKQAKADLMTISCRCFEANAEGEVKIPVFGKSGDFESESVDVTALEGEATAYPEGDENFPELWNQQRATFMQMIDTPYGPELLKEPGNAELFAKLSGIPDLKIPKQDAWRKQLREIAEMTKIPAGGDEELAGLAPMVGVDPKHDDNVTEAACCSWWVNNELGQKMKTANPLGYQAVLEHWDQHTAAIPKAPPAQKPMSETFTANFKDLPPEAQAQALEQMGIHVTPQDFVHQALLEKAKKSAPKPPAPGMPPQSGPPHGAPENVAQVGA